MNLHETLKRNWFEIVAVILIVAAFAVFHHEGPMIWAPVWNATEVGL